MISMRFLTQKHEKCFYKKPYIQMDIIYFLVNCMSFKVISIAIYTFFPPLRKVMNATPIKLFVF